MLLRRIIFGLFALSAISISSLQFMRNQKPLGDHSQYLFIILQLITPVDQQEKLLDDYLHKQLPTIDSPLILKVFEFRSPKPYVYYDCMPLIKKGHSESLTRVLNAFEAPEPNRFSYQARKVPIQGRRTLLRLILSDDPPNGEIMFKRILDHQGLGKVSHTEIDYGYHVFTEALKSDNFIYAKILLARAQKPRINNLKDLIITLIHAERLDTLELLVEHQLIDLPLHRAARYYRGDQSELFIKRFRHLKPKQNLWQAPVESPVKIACRFNNDIMLKALIEHGAKVSIEDLNSTIFPKHLEAARVLLNSDLNVNEIHKGHTVLHEAVTQPKNEAMIRLLLKHGADPYLKDEAGFNTLFYCTNPDYQSILKEEREAYLQRTDVDHESNQP